MEIEDYKKHPDAKFSPNLFWEYDMEHFDWQKMAVMVAQRVVERGWPEDFFAAINLYGLDGFVAAIKEIPLFERSRHQLHLLEISPAKRGTEMLHKETIAPATLELLKTLTNDK